MKVEFSSRTFEKSLNIKFHENPSSVWIEGRTDRHKADMTKLIVASSQFCEPPFELLFFYVFCSWLKNAKQFVHNSASLRYYCERNLFVHKQDTSVNMLLSLYCRISGRGYWYWRLLDRVDLLQTVLSLLNCTYQRFHFRTDKCCILKLHSFQLQVTVSERVSFV